MAALCSLVLVACIDTGGGRRDASVDGGTADAQAPYDPVTGMPFTGPLLLDDARVM